MKYKITLFILGIILLNGCKDDFMDLEPKDKLSIVSTFSNYENIQNFAWQLYETFPAYGRPETVNDSWKLHLELSNLRHSDFGMENYRNTESEWAWQKIPATTDWTAAGTGSYANYDIFFTHIRTSNIILENIDNAKITEKEKEHWKSVAYFFKAYNYMELVKRYGDITWVEENLDSDDTETLMGPRTPRAEVADKILDILNYAEQHINPRNSEVNTVDVHVVRALISRFGLWEGTWRKYHGLSGGEKFLRACVDASEKLVNDHPELMSNYGYIFNSETLEGEPGILLYKAYTLNELHHNLSTFMRDGGSRWDLTKKCINSFLMRDGQTRWTSPLFDGDRTMYDEYRNRDLRLYFMTCVPYQVDAQGMTREWKYTGNPAHTEYFSIMDSLSSDGRFSLPKLGWAGHVVPIIPHFRENNLGQFQMNSFTGYQFIKFSSHLNTGIGEKDINDCPIFRMGEVLMNYAEAKKELGEFNQAVCDMTINRTRARGGVAPLNLGDIPNDPTRDPEIDPEMWEIRRERSIELLGEHDGFRFHDLRRWKKMDYALERKLGTWIVKSEQNNRIPTLNDAEEGYVSYEEVPPSPFPEYYYLYPIPSNEIILTNGAVKQNPGWDQ